MKPYTLEWWFVMIHEAERQKSVSKAKFHRDIGKGEEKEALKHRERGLYLMNLIGWMKYRIIKKYGESE